VKKIINLLFFILLSFSSYGQKYYTLDCYNCDLIKEKGTKNIGTGDIVSGVVLRSRNGEDIFTIPYTIKGVPGGVKFKDENNEKLYRYSEIVKVKSLKDVQSKIKECFNKVPFECEDCDVTNEFQTISIEGNVITLSDGGGSIMLPVDPDEDPLNETIVNITVVPNSDTSEVVITIDDGGTPIPFIIPLPADCCIADLNVTSSGNTHTITVTDTEGNPFSDDLVLNWSDGSVDSTGMKDWLLSCIPIQPDGINNNFYINSDGDLVDVDSIQIDGVWYVSESVVEIPCKDTDFAITPSITVCEGEDVTFESMGGTVVWEDGPSFEDVSLSDGGTYSATITDSEGCEHLYKYSLSVLECLPTAEDDYFPYLVPSDTANLCYDLLKNDNHSSNQDFELCEIVSITPATSVLNSAIGGGQFCISLNGVYPENGIIDVVYVICDELSGDDGEGSVDCSGDCDTAVYQIIVELPPTESRVVSTEPDYTTGTNENTVTNTKNGDPLPPTACASGECAKLCFYMEEPEEGTSFLHECIIGTVGSPFSSFTSDTYATGDPKSILSHVVASDIASDCSSSTWQLDKESFAKKNK